MPYPVSPRCKTVSPEENSKPVSLQGCLCHPAFRYHFPASVHISVHVNVICHDYQLLTHFQDLTYIIPECFSPVVAVDEREGHFHVLRSEFFKGGCELHV